MQGKKMFGPLILLTLLINPEPETAEVSRFCRVLSTVRGKVVLQCSTIRGLQADDRVHLRMIKKM